MTTNNQPALQPPDRIWIDPKDQSFWNDNGGVRGLVEYARVTRFYFCSCGGALTAEEYIEHYFEKGHDRGDPAFSPVVRVRDGVVATVDEVIESTISHASGLCNRGRFEDAFSVMVNALKSFGSQGRATTAPIAVQSFNDALSDLFALLERDSAGHWNFLSLSRDANKFDEIMERLHATIAAPQAEPHRCPSCGRRMQSDFDPDVGMWY